MNDSNSTLDFNRDLQDLCIRSVFVSLQSLLQSPNPFDDPVAPDVAAHFRVDAEGAAITAQLWTKKFATH